MSGKPLPDTPEEGEFGHHSVIAKLDDYPVCVDSWGSGPFIITAADRSYRFEDSDRFGPSLIGKRGEILTNPWPAESSPFWRAHLLWRHQGRRVAGDGVTCIWHEPKPTYYRIEKRGRQKFVILVEQGEPHGKEIDVTDA